MTTTREYVALIGHDQKKDDLVEFVRQHREYFAGERLVATESTGVRITADGKKAYVALGPANRVAVVNAETYEVEKYVLVGQRVWQLAFTPDQKTIISTNGVSNDITFIDVETDEPVQSVTVGALPWGVVVSPQ